MAREKKPVQLRTVDDRIARPGAIRLDNPETAGKTREGPPVRLGFHPGKTDVSQRLELPAKDEAELRTHQPGIDSLIESEPDIPELLEQKWGDGEAHRKSIPWGWFALITIIVTGAVVWSSSRVGKSEVLAKQIRTQTESTLVNEAMAEREAAELVDRLDKAVCDFFAATSVESLISKVRHPTRLASLLREYYADQVLDLGRLVEIESLRPLSENFWTASVVMGDRQTHYLILEVLESGEALVDWEAWVCYQPILWDDFVARRPARTPLDFRVYAERDLFFSHEFEDSTRWASFRLTAKGSTEVLFGYARVGSDVEQELQKWIDENDGRKIAPILRLGFPEGYRSPRGVVIEKLLSSRWVYPVLPDTGP
jgi:hypothetical protein